MSFYNIPLYIFVEQDNDVDSVASFVTTSTLSNCSGGTGRYDYENLYVDSESRWGHEFRQTTKEYRPHHPKRSDSLTKPIDALKCLGDQHNYNSSRRVCSPRNKRIPARLTRMAERAKASHQYSGRQRSGSFVDLSIPPPPIRRKSFSNVVSSSPGIINVPRKQPRRNSLHCVLPTQMKPLLHYQGESICPSRPPRLPQRCPSERTQQ